MHPAGRGRPNDPDRHLADAVDAAVDVDAILRQHGTVQDGLELALGDIAYVTQLRAGGIPRPIAWASLIAMRLAATIHPSLWHDCDD